MFARIAECLGADLDAVLDAWGGTYRDRMEGRLRDDDLVFQPLADALGVDPSASSLRTAALIRSEFMRETLLIKPDAIDTLERLRAAGLVLALATDCTSGTPALLDETLLGPFFKIRAISSDLGVMKPDPIVYQHVLRELSVSGEDCWYVGDGNHEELLGARRHGMRTVWVDNGDRQFHRSRFVPTADHTVRNLAEIPSLLALR